MHRGIGPAFMINALHPDHLTAAERIAAVADILAAGLIRLRLPKSSGRSVDHGDCCLDLPDLQSRHEPVKNTMETER